jgi:tetratricopeptide (TPR) repeat protein
MTIGLSGPWAARAVADPGHARAHFELAKRYFQVDEYRKAIEEFKAAHIEAPDPAFLYDIAECHRHLGESRDALVFYRRFLALSPPNTPTRAIVEKRIAELQAATRDAYATAGSSAPLAPASPSPMAEPSAAARPTAPEATPLDLAPPAGGAMSPTILPAAAPPGPSTEGSIASSTSGRSTRFYKSAWFYALLGGALVAGGLGVWALSSGKDQAVPATPLGNQPVFR